MSEFLRAVTAFVAAIGLTCLALNPTFAQKANQQPGKTSKAKTSNSKTKSAEKTKTSASTKKSGATKSKKTANTKKPTSPCQGLAKSSCERKKDLCSWISPKKKVDTRGRKLKAYCRKTGGFAKSKKTDTKKSSAKKTGTKKTSTKSGSTKKASNTTKTTPKKSVKKADAKTTKK